MKRLFFLTLATFFIISCGAKSLNIVVENPCNFSRSNELVEISDSYLQKLPLSHGKAYIVKNAKGVIVPSQLTYEGKLIFQLGVKKGSANFTITTGTPQIYEAKTYGRFITERKDDFTWENDRIAMRVYGPALIASDGPSNGIDFWYKRTSNMIIDKWYKDEVSKVKSYHVDGGEGFDDYKVGHSLGGGAMAPFVDGKLWMNENFVTQEILENGPLRTTVKFTYKDLEINGNTFSETRTISIDAGAQYTKVVQEYGVKSPLTVAAGIADRDTTDSTACIADNNFMIYTETSQKAGEVYVGVIFPTGIEEIVSNTYTYENPVKKDVTTYSHHLALTTYNPGKPFIYYTGFGWSQFGFVDNNAFIKYTQNFEKALSTPLRIKFK